MNTDSLTALAQSMTREEFARRVPGDYLVIEQVEDDRVAFSTQIVDPAALKRGAHLSQRFEVMPIVKAPGNPYPDRVSLGRARNCDLVMREPSISKLHAHFRLGGPQLEVVDIDSQNGTRLNGRQLVPHQPAKVASGDQLSFGSVTGRLVNASGLWELLR